MERGCGRDAPGHPSLSGWRAKPGALGPEREARTVSAEPRVQSHTSQVADSHPGPSGAWGNEEAGAETRVGATGEYPHAEKDGAEWREL